MSGDGSGREGRSAVQQAAKRIVDVHIHAIPPTLIERIEQGGFPDVGVTATGRGMRFAFPGMEPSPPAPAGLADFPGLAEWGREKHIDLQLVSPWTDLLGYTLPRSQAGVWTRAYNEATTAACADQIGMLPMATIPLQFPDLAVLELEAASAMGCRGAMIGTDIPGSGLGAPDLDVVWEAAAGLSMPLLVHPTFIRIPPELLFAGLKNAVGRAGVATIALTRLVHSGALLRHPDLTVIGALGGGGLVPLSRRIIRNHEVGWSDTDVDVEASLRRLLFDSVVIDPAFLRYLVRQVGAERVMLGSDYPFPWEPDPVRLVGESDLDSDEAASVLGVTASRVFDLS
ncbi:amidohydrolase family protein [bacterium]|nr:amidohydrolase family protein [bacterium]